MAKPIDFAESNLTLGPPKDWDEKKQVHAESCTHLPVHAHPDGTKLISCWELSEAEALEVHRSGRIWLWVWCDPRNRTQPPVCVTALDPFTRDSKTPAPTAGRFMVEAPRPHTSHDFAKSDGVDPPTCQRCGVWLSDAMAVQGCQGAMGDPSEHPLDATWPALNELIGNDRVTWLKANGKELDHSKLEVQELIQDYVTLYQSPGDPAACAAFKDKLDAFIG